MMIGFSITQIGVERVMYVFDVEMPRIRIKVKEGVVAIVNNLHTVAFSKYPKAAA